MLLGVLALWERFAVGIGGAITMATPPFEYLQVVEPMSEDSRAVIGPYLRSAIRSLFMRFSKESWVIRSVLAAL